MIINSIKIPLIGQFELVIAMVLCFLTYLLFTFFLRTPLIDYVCQEHVDKLLARRGSGALRFNTAMYGFKLFMQYPVLGVGIGSNRTAALLSSLLCNIGLLGTVPFLLFNGIVLRNGLEVCQKTANVSLAIITLALLVSFASSFGVMLFGKSDTSLHFLPYWLILAMITASYRFYKKGLRS